MKKKEWWGFSDGSSLECKCGAVPQTMEHLTSCPACPTNCTQEDLMNAADSAIHVAEFWADTITVKSNLIPLGISLP
ncbi:unnamed protein product, partial [Iphiclides podalirius]